MTSALKTELFGLKLKSPVIVGSGPLTYNAEGMIRAHKAGAGAVVTKTIRKDACVNPMPHMVRNTNDSLLNCEKWADIPGRQWIDEEIPKAVRAGAVVIGNVGHSAEDIKDWIKPLEQAGVAAIEIVSYEQENILGMADTARRLTDIPIIIKLNPNWADPVSTAVEAVRIGVDAISAMDSVGPVLRIDIRTGKPLVGGVNGSGWLTGAAIKPIVLRYIADLALKTDKPIIGIGGIMNEADAVEYLMAGASAVGVCTAPILRGVGYIGTLNKKLSALLSELGYEDVRSISGSALANLECEENIKKICFSYDEKLCMECGRCVTVCPYNARKMSGKEMSIIKESCRYCGLCSSVCSTGALKIMSSQH